MLSRQMAKVRKSSDLVSDWKEQENRSWCYTKAPLEWVAERWQFRSLVHPHYKLWFSNYFPNLKKHSCATLMFNFQNSSCVFVDFWNSFKNYSLTTRTMFEYHRALLRCFSQLIRSCKITRKNKQFYTLFDSLNPCNLFECKRCWPFHDSTGIHQ